MFLNVETGTSPMHLTSLLIFDQSDVPDGHITFKQILELVRERAGNIPTYRQRLLKVPLGLGYPWWYDDNSFDIEFHVRHIALPQPGNWRQLCIQTARLASRPLDMQRALWEMTIIEGLNHVDGVAPGSFALVLKIHHAAIDGASGTHLLSELLDASPIPQPHERAWNGAGPTFKPPPPLELAVKAVTSTVRQQVGMAKSAAQGLPALKELVRGLPDTREIIGNSTTRAPATVFDGKVSPHRVFDGTTIELDSLKPIRAEVEGATVNDVLLSIVAGGLRSYLTAQGELPEESLRVAVPISVRAEGDTQAGNQVSAMVVPLHTDIDDAQARLAAITESTQATKVLASAVGATNLTEVASATPAVFVALGTRLAAQLGLTRQASQMMNTTVTNVPGSRTPLYLCGAKLVGYFGMGPLLDGAGLFHSIMGVERTLFLSMTSCREMMPDPGFYRECLEASVAEHRSRS